MIRLTNMDLPPGSPASALAEAVQSQPPVRAVAERQASILVRVLRCGRARRPGVLALLSPATLSLVLLSFGIATAAAAIAPHLGWHRAAEPGPPAGEHPVERPAAAVRRRTLAEIRPEASPVRPVRPRAPGGESPARLMAAVRALRTDGQPARAEQLALDYLRLYPRGALSEEALAVAIEAAVLSGDSRAVPLARRYLQQHPTGRYRRVADETLARLP